VDLSEITTGDSVPDNEAPTEIPVASENDKNENSDPEDKTSPKDKEEEDSLAAPAP